MEDKKFYEQTWFVILMIVVVWPVGLILMWVQQKFSMAVRVILTLLFVAAVVGALM